MMKYIVCSLVGIFLMLGCALIPNGEWQEFRSETGTTNIQSYTHSYKFVESESHAGSYSGKYDYKINDGILVHALSPRPASPSQIIRFHVPSVTIQLLSTIKIQLIRSQYAGLSYDTNPAKYSYRYYIYTLRRMLI